MGSGFDSYRRNVREDLDCSLMEDVPSPYPLDQYTGYMSHCVFMACMSRWENMDNPRSHLGISMALRERRYKSDVLVVDIFHARASRVVEVHVSVPWQGSQSLCISVQMLEA